MADLVKVSRSLKRHPQSSVNVEASGDDPLALSWRLFSAFSVSFQYSLFFTISCSFDDETVPL